MRSPISPMMDTSQPSQQHKGMEQAQSIYLSKLMSALIADYNTSIDYGLVCPWCYKEVFFAQGSTRIVNGKEQSVKPHFRHYKADSDQARECEARALSREGREYLQKFTAEAKGQRIYLWDRRLWAMISDKKYIPKSLDKALKHKLPEEIYEEVPLIIKTLSKIWLSDRKEISECIKQNIRSLNLDAAMFLLPDMPTEKQRQADTILSETRAALSNPAQYAICEEVIDYLGKAANHQCFEDLVKLAILDAYEV